MASRRPRTRSGHAPGSATWILNLRGLSGTLERLRIDRRLEEAITAGTGPSTWPRSSA